MSCNPPARLKKFRWPVMIVELRKGLKNSKILKTPANLNKILFGEIRKKTFHQKNAKNLKLNFIKKSKKI